MDVFKKVEFDSMWDELHNILMIMDVPEKRKDDIRWLGRNLGIRNGSNPKFKRADEILKILLRNEEL